MCKNMGYNTKLGRFFNQFKVGGHFVSLPVVMRKSWRKHFKERQICNPHSSIAFVNTTYGWVINWLRKKAYIVRPRFIFWGVKIEKWKNRVHTSLSPEIRNIRTKSPDNRSWDRPADGKPNVRPRFAQPIKEEVGLRTWNKYPLIV